MCRLLRLFRVLALRRGAAWCARGCVRGVCVCARVGGVWCCGAQGVCVGVRVGWPGGLYGRWAPPGDGVPRWHGARRLCPRCGRQGFDPRLAPGIAQAAPPTPTLFFFASHCPHHQRLATPSAGTACPPWPALADASFPCARSPLALGLRPRARAPACCWAQPSHKRLAKAAWQRLPGKARQRVVL